jgi:hypothetical protein
MARKPRKPSRELAPANRPQPLFPPRFRAPRELRVVSTQSVRTRVPGKSGQAKRQLVPQIRLSGMWLERVGFMRSKRFVVLADVPNQIVLALVDL